MIDDSEPHTRILSVDLIGSLPNWALAATFTAPEDLTLRQVLFAGSGSQLLTIDPDLTALVAGQVYQDFQLIAIADAGRFTKTQFSDLSYPLAKHQTLYWATIDPPWSDQTIQLIFS